MIFSKFIKLITHFVRYPVDIFLWPVSILFGWFHGAIKMWALVTLNEVCSPRSHVQCSTILTRLQTTWGSRTGADADDKDRMIKQKQRRAQYEYYFDDEKLDEKAPLYEDTNNTTPTYDTRRNPATAA